MSGVAMENGGSESTMHVLVWGIGLLGGIGFFIVWGLTNAYPGVS